MRYFSSTEELLQLFGIDPEKRAAQEFCMLVDLMALMLHYPQYGVTVSEMAAVSQRRLKWSAKVYWSTIKRTIKPILDAEPATLRDLGVPIICEGRERTCPELAHAIAEALADLWDGLAEDGTAASEAAEIARACGRAK